MPRTLSISKLESIVAGAGRVFALVGYKRAMMSDIADEAGVALGTIYKYAEDKEELFQLALRWGMGEEIAWPPTSASGRNGFDESIYDFARTRFAFEDLLPEVARVSQHLDEKTDEDAVAELMRLMGEVYDMIARHHVAIRMLDRSTATWPELEDLFAIELRAPLVRAIELYLRHRCASGALRSPPDLSAAARLSLEILATQAMHRRFSSGGAWTSDAVARESALYAVKAIFAPCR